MTRPSTLRLAALSLLLPASVAAAQTILTAPSYVAGQQYRLQLETTTEDVRDTPPKKHYIAPITLRVVRRSTEGTFLDWVTGKSSDNQERADPVLELAEHIFENLHLTVHLDPSGKYQGIDNEDELKTKIQEFELLLIPQVTARIPDPAERRRAADAIAKRMTPEAMLSAAREEVDLYFGIAGQPLEMGKTLPVPSSALNPFGKGQSLESEIEVTPRQMEAATGEARVEFRQQFGLKGAGGAGTERNLSYQSQSAGEPGLTLTDAGEFVLDTATGRVKQVRHVRTILQSGKPVRTETTAVTLQ